MCVEALQGGESGVMTNVTDRDLETDRDMERFVEPHIDRKSTRLNSSHLPTSRMPSSA